MEIQLFIGYVRLPTEIDVIAIILMESFAVVFFLSAFIIINLSRRIGGKIEALQEALEKAPVTGERLEESCYSYKWVMGHSLKSRNLVGLLVRSIGPGGFLMGCIMALSLFLGVVLLIIFHSAGYTMFIALTGAAIIFETDAFEAYSYAKSVQKVALEQLVKEDQSYMEIAKEVFERAALRFLVVGTTFAVAGPFVPQIFQGLIYAFSIYTNILFQATETALNVSFVLAIIIAFILPAILLYLPELVGKTIFRKTKELTLRMRKREGEH